MYRHQMISTEGKQFPRKYILKPFPIDVVLKTYTSFCNEYFFSLSKCVNLKKKIVVVMKSKHIPLPYVAQQM